jgi:hypothetical protein
MKPIMPTGAPGKIGKAVAGLTATGRHGGKLQKVAAGKMGHSQAPVTPVKSDRGDFKIKG